MKLVFFGPPGSGKGTYSTRVAEKLRIPHISTGDIFRDNVKKQTPLGKKVEDLLKQGKLVPDEITNEIVKKRLSESDCMNGFALDGYPRTMAQAKALDSYQKIDAVINIEVPENVIMRRITTRRMCKCGASYNTLTLKPKKDGVCDKCSGELYQRSDDTEEAVKKRLEEYDKLTRPLLDYYSAKKIVKTVKWDKKLVPKGDIDIPIDTMLRKILEAIGK
ncbi:MAG: adenylate kinase [archaeon]